VLFNRTTSSNESVRQTTASVIARVRAEGDAALRAFAQDFDGVGLDSLEVPRERIHAALATIPRELEKALRRAADNIRRVHDSAPSADRSIETEPGIVVSRRARAFHRVGLYAPGGRASYPSSVLMGAIPARCAGVRELILCSPPANNGEPLPAVLAAAAIAGVDRVFSVGGAGAIAAMALGTETVPRVQKVVGPGNAYVAEAKLQLSGFVSFDAPAGPSELLVIADDGADCAVVAREMFAQAEHDPSAVVVAVCASQSFAEELLDRIANGVSAQPRREIVAAALADRGAILWSPDMQQAIAFASEFAPEHLLIVADNDNAIGDSVRNCGTIFLGEYSSVVFGDYMTGANHVLPSGSLARSYSGLSTHDFVQWTTSQRVSREAARAMSHDVWIFASAENLPAHAEAARAWGDL
jgi:histidinol dehydrogenase